MSNKPFKVQDGIEFADGTTLTTAGLLDDPRLWIRFFGVSSLTSRFSLSTKFDNDGNIVFLGLEVQGEGDTSFPVVSKMDNRGNLIWQKDFNNELDFVYIPYGLAVDNDNNIFISVSSYPVGRSWVFKLDSNGSILWQKEIQVEGLGKIVNIAALEVTYEGDVIGCGSQAYERAEDNLLNRVAAKSTDAGTLKLDKAANTMLTGLVDSNRWSGISFIGTGGSTHPYVQVTDAYTDSSDIILNYNAGEGQAISAGEQFTVAYIAYDIDFTTMKLDGESGDIVWHKAFGKANIDESSLGMSLSRQEIDGTVRDIFTVTGSISEDSNVSSFAKMNIYSFESDGSPLVTVADPYYILNVEVAPFVGAIYDSAFDSSGNLYAIGTIAEGGLSYKNGLFLMKMTKDGILEWAKTFLNTSNYDTRGCSLVVNEDVVYTVALDIPRDGELLSASILSFSASTGNLIKSSTLQKFGSINFDLSNFINGHRHGSLIDYKDGYINYCISVLEGSFIKFAVGSLNASLPETHIVDWLLDTKYTYTNSDLSLDLIDQVFGENGNVYNNITTSEAVTATDFAAENSSVFSVLLNTSTVFAYTGDITFSGVSIIGSGSAGQFGQGTIELVPDIDYYTISGTGYGDLGGQYLIIDPTTPNHIHIRAGGPIDEAPAQLILGGEKANVTVRDQDDSYVEKHYVTINTQSNTGDEYAWVFGNDGNLTMPNGSDLLDEDGNSLLFNHTEAVADSTTWPLVMTTNSTTYLIDGSEGYSLTLPAIADVQLGWEITIADKSDQAGTNPIGVNTASGDAFVGYGATSLSIDNNSGLVRLQVTSQGWLILYTK